jgi:hypothetical protein
MKIRTFLLVILLVVGVTIVGQLLKTPKDEEVAVRALKTQGYTDVRVINRDTFYVGDLTGHDDAVDTRFTVKAVDTYSKDVELCVFVDQLSMRVTIETK